MENATIQKLASSGLGDFTLPKADTESRGTDPGKVDEACGTLTTESSDIHGFIDELETTKTKLLASWEGESADKFETQFPKLISVFEQIPTCVNSIATWASEVSAGYVKIDQGSF